MPEFDDLTRIRGIGPTFAALLRRSGVVTFGQLAQMTTTAINEIIGRQVARNSWIRQAKSFEFNPQRPQKETGHDRMTVDELLAKMGAKERKQRSKKSAASSKKTTAKQGNSRSLWIAKMAQAESVLKRVAKRLFARHPEIISIDIEKKRSKKELAVPKICITIDDSKSRKMASKNAQSIPEQIDGFPVEITTCSNGSFFLAARPRIQGGTTFQRSAAPLGDGTIGVMVQDLGGIKNTPAFLTAGHVCRGGCKRVDDAVATMKRASLVVGEMRLTPRLYVENDVADAALVLASPAIDPMPFLPHRKQLKFRSPRQSDVGSRIEKLGRNQLSGVGVIRSVSCGRTRLNSDLYNPVGYVVHHLLIERLSGSFARGDSGAAIVLNQKWIIGFLRAVTENGQLVLASRFDMIKKNLVAFKIGTPK